MTRPSRDEFWFRIAADYALMATCPRASIGTVIVNPTTRRQVGAGYNGAPTGQAHCTEVGCLMIPGADHCIRATHAEINAAEQVTPGLRNLVAYVVGGRDVCSHCARELYAVGVREIHARPAVPSLDRLARDIHTWGAETFPNSTAASTVEHLRREVYELLESPCNGEEQADVFHLLVQLARTTSVDLAEEVARKFAINRVREWQAADNQGVVEHIRGHVAGGWGARALHESIEQGNTIEIPSLNVTYSKADGWQEKQP